jgi:hypothetical protein
LLGGIYGGGVLAALKVRALSSDVSKKPAAAV